MPEAITCQNVTKRIGDQLIVDDVSLTLEPGTVTALLGASGAGKSTLLRLIAGLETLDAGDVNIGTRTLSSKDQHIPAEQRNIGLIFQDFALFPHMTIQKNIAFGLNALPKTDVPAIVSTWLDRMDLTDKASAYPNELSGGEQQRVAIARALAPRPAALLMDEPFSGLDPFLRESVRTSALSAVKEAGIPVLLVTHDPEEAMRVADQVSIMSEGANLQAGTIEEVYNDPASLTVAKALGPLNALETRYLPEHPRFSPFMSADTVYFRPQAVLLETDGVPGRITDKQLIGPVLLLQISVDSNKIQAYVPPDTAINIGDFMHFRMTSPGTFIFASDQS